MSNVLNSLTPMSGGGGAGGATYFDVDLSATGAAGAGCSMACRTVLPSTKVAVVYWRYGVILRWHMPEQYWGFGFYLDVLVVMAVGFAAPFLGALGWVAHRVARSADRTAGA